MEPVGASSVTGIVSGLDTNAIVEAIIAADRGQALLFESRVAENTNKITTYQAVEAKLLAIQSRLGALGKAATFAKMKFSSSDEDAVSITGSGETAPGTFDLRVLALARNHQIVAQGVSDPSAATLGTGTITVGVGGATAKLITLEEGSNSLNAVRDAINDAEIGVTASIVNDGTDKNAYRLILTSDKTGLANRITVTTDLTGGVGLNFDTASFDAPETQNFSALATSAVSLGSTAAYIGGENKTYTFTVQGSGAQTIGTDIITLDWTDGVNSGSVVVTQADMEVALAGAGSDGLSLSFAAGDLIGGDSFTVQSFSPTLQEPSDAQIAVGSSAGGGSPIVITSASNTFDSAIPGMSLTVKKVTSPTDVVTLSAERDVAGIRGEIQGFVDAYNDAMTFIDQQFKYDTVRKQAGVLMSEGLLRTMQESVRSSATSIVADVGSKYNTLATLGIRSDADGLLRIADANRLDDAIANNINDVRRLFVKDISSSSDKLEFLAAPDDIRGGVEYKVVITQAATAGALNGAALTDPSTTPLVIDSSNSALRLSVDGRVSDEIRLTEGTYTSFDQLVRELQKRIDADAQIGALGVNVSYTAEGGSGSLTLTSGSFGSSSRIEYDNGAEYLAGGAALGLSNGTTVTGQDVAGTINGEAAKGAGQTLTGEADNATTAGVKLKVSLSEADVADGGVATFQFLRGISARVRDTLFRITDSVDGSIGRRTKALSAQVEDFKSHIKRIDERLALKRQRLIEQFRAMEEVLGQLNTQSAYLANGLAALSSNFSAQQ